MNIGDRAKLRTAHVASRYNPRLDVRTLAAGRVPWKSIAGSPNSAQTRILCDVFQVPEWYWTAEDRTVIDAGAELPFEGLEPIAEVSAADLVWLAFIERHQKREPGATLRDLIEAELGAGSYHRFMQSAYDGMRTMRTMERASAVLGVPVAYWMIRDLDAARAVAAGRKTVGVVDAA